MAQTDTKQNIKTAIERFQKGNLTDTAHFLFKTLGYNIDRQQPFEKKTYAYFKDFYLDGNNRFNEKKALVDQWHYIDLLFQLSKDEISSQLSLFDTKRVDRTIIETYLFFAIELNNESYSRTALSQITREINKIFPMPVMMFFKHGKTLTLSVINRRLHKKDERKDVLEKVTLIKDISIENPHRAHIEILFDLSFSELLRAHKFTNFVELHTAWQKTLDTKELNKRFYQELSNWYFWAMHEVTFPGASLEADKTGLFQQEDKVREHNAKNLIRLLTRILFVWFFKEKNLIPDALFDEAYIRDNLINGFEPRKKSGFSQKTQESKYYRAILQNLFFATLNQTVGKREFRKQGQQMNVTNLMRYESYFKKPETFIKLVEEVVPFMNGGLFECLDSPDPVLKGKKGGDVIIYEDGFSDRKDNPLCVPDYIFFGVGEHADLSEELGNKKQKDVTVSGLIQILKSYKFTVTENTPIEEDIALDPELLGRVFENLLASYNPETKTTARKQTGSFYTPREIVGYMVDESLKAHLKQKLETEADMKPEDAEAGLDLLLGYNEKDHLFDEKETTVLINAIDTCKILDPACGSGAFPMGILHKLVHILHKLDPNNEKWRELQRQKAIKETEDAFRIGNKQEREDRLKEISDVFENNSDDYGRKLFLIENCIYGVDIQPIATQISKLRFFISLIVDQKTDKTKDNFGIRPLPNLETKFVAANTLIGIEKPDQQLILFENAKVKELEKQIKDVRHRLFSAKTPGTKRKLREEDRNLREEMGNLLIGQGWGNETARRLAGWDPYNQNASSPFFDPEWMFGIADGFDVVIGNPPYGLVGRDQVGARAYYISGRFKLTAYKINLYVLFLERGLKSLNRPTGILSFIIPKSLVFNSYFETTRRTLLNEYSIPLIVEVREKVFETAEVGDSVLFFGYARIPASESNLEYKIVEDVDSGSEIISIEINRQTDLAKSVGVQFRRPSFRTPKTRDTLGDLWEVRNGLNPGNVRHLLLSTTSLSSKYRKMLLGRDLQRYSLQWSGTWVNFDPSLKETINPSETKSKKGMTAQQRVDFALRSPEIYTANKVMVRKTADHIVACFDADGFCFDSLSYGIQSKDPRVNPKFILGLLNSMFLDRIHADLSQNKEKVFAKVLAENLRKLPMPDLNHDLPKDRAKHDDIVDLVDHILAAKQRNPKANTSEFEREIDQQVYALYNLTPEEIAIVEGKNKQGNAEK